MRKIGLILLVILTAEAALAAQTWSDAFNYPKGTTLGTWKEHFGNWTATGQRAEAENKKILHLLVNERSVLKDAGVQCRIRYNPKSTERYPEFGLMLRCYNPGAPPHGDDLLRFVAQGNAVRGFNAFAIQEIHYFNRIHRYRPLAASATFTAARIRLLALDRRVVAHADTDLDGIWDHTFDLQTVLPAKAGVVGVAGNCSILVDDFMLFDAVLLIAPASPRPSPGSAISFDMRGPANAAYGAAASMRNTGITIGHGRGIPLGLGPLFSITAQDLAPAVFRRFRGQLDANGDGRLGVHLPGSPALVGTTFFTAFVTFDAKGIRNISNDHQVTIVQ